MAPAVSFAMAPTSLLLFRLRLRPSASLCSYLIRSTQHLSSAKPFSSSPEPLRQPDPGPPLPPAPPPSDPKAGLSSRMSFVFDQIDAMERMRGAKDEALQRIRAWRQTKQQQQQEQQDGASGLGDTWGIGSEAVGARVKGENQIAGEKGMVTEQAGSNVFKKEVELVHPWPEWIELMELLVNQNYFDHRRFNEDQVVKDLPIDLSGIAEDVGLDVTRDWATVRTACLNFGRDRFDILRSLSKKDLQILVGHGCPSTDKKVVFSAKLLRKHAHLDEGDVCSACKLRSTCSSGYLPTRKEDEARTLDLMRILLTFAFDSINGSVENKALLKMKSLKVVARKLLHDIVKLGTDPIDPNLPLPVIKRPPPKVKQPPPPPKKRVGRDDVEMKKGDWLCPKCDFMNFAKNVVCLQCDAKRPKRQLLPGEWECPECNFLNYRRNMACFHCDHKRPPDEFTENKMQFRQEGPRTRLDRTAGPKFSSGWNFDFDENESDGVDVAAFEFADPPRTSDGSVDVPLQRGATRGPEDNISEVNSMPRFRDSKNFSGPDDKAFSPVPRTGFDDFDDEDDDVDSYEIDHRPANPIRVVSAENVSKFESSAGSEDSDDFEDDHRYLGSYNATSSRPTDYSDQDNGFESESTGRPQCKTFSDRTSISGRNNQNKGMSDDVFGLDSDFDDDIDLESASKQRRGVEHNAHTRGPERMRNSFSDRTSISGRNNQNKRFSDDVFGLDSDFDDDIDLKFASKQRRGVEHNAHTRGPERMRNSVSEDDLFGSESDDCDYSHSNRNKTRGNGGNTYGRGNYLRKSDNFHSAANGKGSGRGNGANSYGNNYDGWPSGGSSRRTQGARTDGNHAQRWNNEKYGVQRFERPQKRQFEYRQGGESNRFNDRSRRSYDYKQRGESNHEYKQRGESNRNDRSRRSYEYKQRGESNWLNDRSRCSDEYRQQGKSNRWNNRSDFR